MDKSKLLFEITRVKSLLRSNPTLSSNLAYCDSLLSKLKIEILKLNITPPFVGNKDSISQELVLAREVYELATEVSIRRGDEGAFNRNMAQLKPFYYEYSSILPASEKKYSMIGLLLLSLLARNKIGEFHSELELIPSDKKSLIYIKFPISLEQGLMEGAYNALLEMTSSSLPLDYYGYFNDILISTVRQRVADCCEKSYATITISDAAKILRCNESDVISYCNSRGGGRWEISNDSITFKKKNSKLVEMPSERLLRESLSYASEMEKII